MYLYISEAGWYLTGACIFFLVAFMLFLFFFLKVKQQQNQLLLKEQRAKYEYERTIVQSQLEIQEQTLKNISQEIHDNIGQALTLAKLNLNSVLPATEGLVQEKIINSKGLISKAIGDLRDLSRSLDTDYVKEMGLQRAIEYELEIMQKTGVIDTRLETKGAMIQLNKQKELILFRIVQEIFHNVIKHAEAAELYVNINYQAGFIELVIKDNGKGMDLTSLNEENNTFGLGIRNMHSRAKLIGAGFSMSSILGTGTEVKISLSIDANNHENK